MDLLLVATSALGVDSRTHLPKISTFSQCSTQHKSLMHSLGLLNVLPVRMYKVSSILQSPLRGFANFSNLNNLRASASALRQNYSLVATKNSNEEKAQKKEH